jgi:PAP2 superfamily
VNEEAALDHVAPGAEGPDGSLAGAVAAPQHAHLGRRNDRLLLAALVGYAVLLSILMIARGISVTPDVVVVSFGLAALLLGRGKLFLRDWIPFIALFFAYELMRGYADKFGLPIHVTDVVAIERVIGNLLGMGELPTIWLQNLLHHGGPTSPDNVATVAEAFYFLHFPLPLAIGFLLWIHQRRSFYDYVGALILLSMAGFVTYLLLPVAPPWWADQHGYISGVMRLSGVGFDGLKHLFGFSDYFFSYQNVYSISSNDVAAFPSLHAGYPFLAFLFARRAFGRAGWLMLAYTACVWFSIVYLGEHWVFDIVGGVAYASAAYFALMHGPAWARRFMERVADEEIEAGVEAEDEGEAGALRRLGRRVRWSLVAQGLAAALVGASLAYGMNRLGWVGGSGSALYLLPWLAVLGGLWRSAAGLVSQEGPRAGAGVRAGFLRAIAGQVSWRVVGEGLALAVAGVAAAAAMSEFGWLGGPASALFLMPWLAIMAGVWRGTSGLAARQG